MAAPAAMPVAVSVRGLTIAHAGRLVLEDISLSVPAGAVTAILGEAGAGKTMLLASIAGLVKAGRGAVLVGGTDVTGKRQSARGVGFLPPGTSLGRDARRDATVVRLMCNGGRIAVQCDSALGRLHPRCDAAHGLRHGMASPSDGACRRLSCDRRPCNAGVAHPGRKWRAIRAGSAAGGMTGGRLTARRNGQT